METMGGSQRQRTPGTGGGLPASLSGGGLPHSTSECTKSTFTVSTPSHWSRDTRMWWFEMFEMFGDLQSIAKSDVKSSRVICMRQRCSVIPGG